MKEAPLGAQDHQQPGGAPSGGFHVAWLGERGTGLRHGADGQGIPAGEDLLVTERGFAQGPRLQQDSPGVADAAVEGFARDPLGVRDFVQSVPQVSVRHVKDVAALEVAALGDAVNPTEEPGLLRREEALDLLLCPHVEASLFPLRVGVPGCVEAALRGEEVAEQILQNLPADQGERAIPRDLPRPQIDPG